MNNLIEAAKQHISLRKVGENYYAGECMWCGCDGFTISIPRELFYCFQCSKGGNLEDFSRNSAEFLSLSAEKRKEFRDALLKEAKESKKKFKEELNKLKITKKEIEEQVKGL